MLRRYLVPAVIALLSVTVMPQMSSASAPGPAGTLFLDCGETWGDDAAENVGFTLGNNLICTGDGLIIDGTFADGITIDLGGHRVAGDGGAGDDGVTLNADGVTVRNGTVLNFDHGAQVNGNANTLDQLVLVDNNGDSTQFVGDSNRLQNSTVTRGGNVLLNVTASFTVVSDNAIVDDSIVGNGADGSLIDGNRIVNGTINFAVGADGSQNNTFSDNTITAPAPTGITVSGDTSDGNTISGNIVKGSSGRGIDVNDGDGAVIEANTVTASAQDGIEVRGSATSAIVQQNVSSGNTDDGIQVAGSATGANVNDNTANENGDNGIEAGSGAAPTVEDNAVNFNGFKNGLADDDGLGISSPDGTTGTDNTANGNDVVDPGDPQCNLASLCSAPAVPADDPPVFPCNHTFTIPATFVLRHPLDCATGDALKIAADDVTLDLTIHRVSGGSTVWADASVAIVTPGKVRATVKNGVLVDSGNGVRIADTSLNKIQDVVAARSSGAGIAMYKTSENTLSGGVATDNAGDGVIMRNGDSNRVTDMEISGNSTAGIALVKTSADPAILDDRSSKNEISDSEIVGNGGVGIGLSNANSNQIFENLVTGNDSLGASIAGNVTGSAANVLTANGFVGNEIVGVLVDADSAAGGAGSPKNKLVSNLVSGSNDGIVIRDPESTGTVVKKNTVVSNSRFGVQVQLGATATKAVKNIVTANGSHGIFFDGVVAGKVERNTANRNGFFADSTAAAITGDDIGLGIFASAGGNGCGNKANDNDDPAQIAPAKFKKAC